MTHDELLAKIEYLEQYEFERYDKTFRIFKNSLRAVVELHKPETGWVDGVEVENHHCSCDPYNEYDMGYPCETIQAIEEQLK